jgi:hypothetical protein
MTNEEINKLIKGKEIVGFEFKNMLMLTFTNYYKSLIGKKGVVLEVNDGHPEYTNVKFDCGCYHYPTEFVVKQIQENEKPIDESLLFTEVYKTLTIICKM